MLKGKSSKAFEKRVHKSLMSSYAPFMGNQLMLYLLVWQDKCRREGGKDNNVTEADHKVAALAPFLPAGVLRLVNSDEAKLKSVLHNSSVADYVQAASSGDWKEEDAQFDQAQVTSHNHGEKDGSRDVSKHFDVIAPNDVFRDLLVNTVMSWWIRYGEEDGKGNCSDLSEMDYRTILHLVGLFGYLCHWIEDNTMVLSRTCTHRSSHVVHGALGCHSPRHYIHSRIAAVVSAANGETVISGEGKKIDGDEDLCTLLSPGFTLSSSLRKRMMRATKKAHPSSLCSYRSCHTSNRDVNGGGELCIASAVASILSTTVQETEDRVRFFHIGYRQYLAALFLSDTTLSSPTLSALVWMDVHEPLVTHWLVGDAKAMAYEDSTIVETLLSTWQKTRPLVNLGSESNDLVDIVDITSVSSEDVFGQKRFPFNGNSRPLPHFAYNEEVFITSALWKNVYIFSAATKPFGALWMSEAMLGKPESPSLQVGEITLQTPAVDRTWNKQEKVTAHKEEEQKEALKNCSSLLGVRSGIDFEYILPFLTERSSISEKEEDVKALADFRKELEFATLLAGEISFQKHRLSIYRYLLTIEVQKRKGKSLIFDEIDMSLSRFILLLSILSTMEYRSSLQRKRWEPINSKSVTQSFTQSSESLAEYFRSLGLPDKDTEEESAAKGKLNKIHSWKWLNGVEELKLPRSCSEETLAYVEEALSFEFFDRMQDYYCNLLMKEPYVVCLLQDDSRVLSSFSPNNLATVVGVCLQNFIRRDASFEGGNKEVVTQLSVSYLLQVLSAWPVGGLLTQLSSIVKDNPSKEKNAVVHKALALWKTIISTGAGVSKMDYAARSGGEVRYLSAASLRLFVQILQNEGEEVFQEESWCICVQHILQFMGMATEGKINDYEVCLVSVEKQ